MNSGYSVGEAVEVQRGITEEWNLGDPWRQGIEWDWGPAVVVGENVAGIICKVDGFDGALVWTRGGVRKPGEDRR